MATNGNNSGNVNYSSPGQSNMGITGNLQNRMAGKEYSERFYREKSGYLDNSITEVQNLLKYYEEISAITKDLSKAEQNRFKKQQDALKEQLKTLEYVKDTREIDFEDSVKLIKEANKLLISGSKEYQRVMEETQESQSNADKEHLGNLEEASETINKIRENAEKTNQDMKVTAKTLNNTSANFGKSLSNTLKSTGDFVANISNMLSLSSLASNAAEQNLRSKLNIQNSVMKQFGMTSDSQYNSFKNSIMDTLWDMNGKMGALFSADDAYEYFQNLTELGITDRKMAEEQLQASVLGSKYLGVSIDTQAQIFKFMKRTSNFDELNNHNKTVVGLLKAELGVSREQLDKLAELTYKGSDSKLAIGMTQEAVSAQSSALETVSAAMASVYGDDAAQAFIESVNDFILNPGNEGWAQTLGGNYSSAYSRLTGAQTYEDQLKAIDEFKDYLSSSSLTEIRGAGGDVGSAVSNKYLQGMTPSTITDSLIVALNSNKNNEYMEAETKAINGVLATTQKDVEKFVEDTSELTALEKIQNTLSFTKDKLDSWGKTFNLANIALAMYIASGAVKLFSGLNNFIGGWKNSGGLAGGLTNLLGGSSGSGTAVSAGMAKFAAGGLAIGLTTAAIAGIAKATSDAVVTYADITEDRKNVTRQRLKAEGNALAGNEAYVSNTSQADVAAGKSGWGGFWRNSC